MPDREQLAEWVRAKRERDTDQTLQAWVLVNHKCICAPVGKNACSRIKLTLHLLEGNDPPDELGEIHGMGGRLAAFGDDSVLEMLTSPEWFRFCFVRNPYDRLISAYKTQVGNTWNRQYKWLKDDIKRALGCPIDEEPERLVPFRDFVRYLHSADERVRRDGHFNTQARVLAPDFMRYDYIGRVETFQADFECVLTRLNAPPEILATASESKNATSKVYPLAIAYDQETADLVFEIYEADFEAFGYERDDWMYA